jgi:hypothetical protein
MFLEERRHLIWQYLNKHERGTVNYFSACHGVSKETIRSDLNILAEMGLVQRCHGGAIILRRSLQSELISETGRGFEVLLQPIAHRKPQNDHQQKGKVMQGKVCVFGSFNVDIVARVERFHAGRVTAGAGKQPGLAVKAQTRPPLQVKPARKFISPRKWEKTSLASLPQII